MTETPHAVTAIVPGTPNRRQRAIPQYRLDLQEKLAMRHGSPSAKDFPRFRMLRRSTCAVNNEADQRRFQQSGPVQLLAGLS